MSGWKGFVVGAAVLAVATVIQAEDITDSELFACSAGLVTVCLDDGTCADGPPWTLNVPHFVKIDLKAKTLRTTRASHENRVTKIQRTERVDGFVVLQGYENGRAFNWLIVEETGMATVTIARDGLSATAFGVCTPMPLE